MNHAAWDNANLCCVFFALFWPKYGTINDYLKESDLEGAKRNLEGNPIPKGNGENWNHEQEVRDAYPALKRAQKTIEGSLKNPNLDSETRGFSQEELNLLIILHMIKIGILGMQEHLKPDMANITTTAHMLEKLQLPQRNSLTANSLRNSM